VHGAKVDRVNRDGPEIMKFERQRGFNVGARCRNKWLKAGKIGGPKINLTGLTGLS
jgi:hypothetical protein